MLVLKDLPKFKKRKFSYRPDFIAASVETIDFEFLEARGIKACFVDLDGTTVKRGTYEVSAQIIRALKSQPLACFIATNRPKSRDLKNLKDDLHANGVIHPKGLIGKPLPYYYRHGLD